MISVTSLLAAGEVPCLTRKNVAMKIFSARGMRELDRLAWSQCGISSLILMEHAGLEVARTVVELLGDPRQKRVAVVCGGGNNGGDGLVAARILHDCGVQVSVVLLEEVSKLKGDAAANHKIVEALGIPVVPGAEKQKEALEAQDCLVDAIFGIGLARPVEGPVAFWIEAINAVGKPIVSIDLPSGIDADSGKVLGRAVNATITVTLGAPKTGLFLHPGRSHAGTVKVAYIGIPTRLIDDFPSAAVLVEKELVSAWLPRWRPDIHKGERGRVMILGGSRGLSGAPALGALGALYGGAGLVYLAVPDGIRTLMEHKLTEIIKVGIPQTGNWVLGKVSLEETRAWWDRVDALAIGPGIGRAAETQEYVKTVVREYRGPLVVDADALFALDEKFLKESGRPSMILTPHEGEMARLCGLPSEEVRENRLAVAREKSKEWNVTLLLKGAGTLVASGDELYINPTGNPGMATGGTGDVLTGLLAAFLGAGLLPEKAAAAAAFVHGLAGDILKEERGERGIAAELLAQNLHKAFKRLGFS